MDEEVSAHTKRTLKDAVTITCTMIAALLAAEGRLPDVGKIAKFMIVYVVLVVILRVNHDDVAKQIMTAVSIGCGSKLLEIITRK